MLFSLKNIFEVNSNIIFFALVLTLMQFVLSYFLSSKENYGEVKNLALLFVFNLLSLYYIYKAQSGKNLLYTFLCIFNLMAFVLPFIGNVTEPIFLKRLMKDVLFFISVPALCFCLANGFGKLKYLSGISMSVCILLCLFSILLVLTELVYYYNFGGILSSETIVSIISSDKKETIEFIEAYLGYIKLGTLVCAAFCIVVVVIWNVNKLFYVSFDVPVKLGIVISVILIGACLGLLNKTCMMRNVLTAFDLKKNIKNFAIYSQNRVRDIDNKCDGTIHKTGTNSSFAIVIGESQTRSKMHAYGYGRQNTIFLDENVKLGNTFLINNGFSCSALTHVAVPYALTERSQYNDMDLNTASNLVEMAKHAGFKVVWITNQISSTMPDINGIMKEADEVYSLNTSADDANLRKKNSSLDSKIVDCLDKIDRTNDRTLYIIHLLGSHSVYKYRYPEEYNKWQDEDSTDANTVNTYDNSILYNDYIMECIGKILFGRLNVDAMLYFADHGEEVGKYFRHGDDFFLSKYKVEETIHDIVKIPVYLRTSADFRNENSDKIANWQKNNMKFYFTNDMVYDTMLGLMNIRCQRYNSSQDFSCASFEGRIDRLKTMSGKIKIDLLK